MGYFQVNREYPFGIDLSVYSANAERTRFPDFDQIAAHTPKVEFIAMRASQSTGYRDPTFKLFAREGLRVGACVLPYHVLYPGVPALRQVNAFLEALAGLDLNQVRLVLDVELAHNQSRAVITNTLLASLELLKQETGRWPIVYSRALWIDEHVRAADLPELDWWLAQYHYRRTFPDYSPEFRCPPMLPRGVTRWLIHQTAERAPAIGGVGHYMDYDRWNGTSADLLRYFGRHPGTTAQTCPLDGQHCDGRFSACGGLDSPVEAHGRKPAPGIAAAESEED